MGVYKTYMVAAEFISEVYDAARSLFIKANVLSTIRIQRTFDDVLHIIRLVTVARNVLCHLDAGSKRSL